MTYEDLDVDTRDLIGSMCKNTGKTKEQAIGALIELGMISMIAAVRPEKEKIMKIIFDTVNDDPKLKKTAEAYKNYWSLNI